MGRKVVITTAPGPTLQIVYDPPLPETVARPLRTSRGANYTKIILRYPTAFWPDTTEMILWVDPVFNRTGFLNYALPKWGQAQSPTLVLLLAGQEAGWASANPVEATQRAKEAVNAMYGGIAQEPVSTLISTFVADSNFGRAWTEMFVGTVPSDVLPLRELYGERLLFAGEAVSKYPGYVHGAYQSGNAAALLAWNSFAHALREKRRKNGK